MFLLNTGCLLDCLLTRLISYLKDYRNMWTVQNILFTILQRNIYENNFCEL